MDKRPSIKVTWIEAGQAKTVTLKPSFKVQSDYEIEAAKRRWPYIGQAPILAMQWQAWQTLTTGGETRLGFNGFRDAIDEFEYVNENGTPWQPSDDDEDDEPDPTRRAEE